MHLTALTEKLDQYFQQVPPRFVIAGKFCWTYSFFLCVALLVVSFTLSLSVGRTTSTSTESLWLFRSFTGFCAWSVLTLMVSTLAYRFLFQNNNNSNNNNNNLFIRTSVANRAARQVDCLYSVYIKEVLKDVVSVLWVTSYETAVQEEILRRQEKERKEGTVNSITTATTLSSSSLLQRPSKLLQRVLFFAVLVLTGEGLGVYLSFFSVLTVATVVWMIYLLFLRCGGGGCCCRALLSTREKTK